MFVGREQELKAMSRMYESDRFEMAVVYGRRRVGKTTLIREFCQDKKAIYFVGIEASEKENLTGLSRAILDVLMPGLPLPSFESFTKLLDLLYPISMKERIVLILDEYPYLAGSFRAISSLLQSEIDHRFKDSRLFLILCGSSMSFMEHQVLGYQSPLYGRRTAQFKIQPFSYHESAQFLTRFKTEDKAVLYGVTGGIPAYLAGISQELGLDDNLSQMFFTSSGRLFEEPFNLLKQELREPNSYHAIVAAIAGGSSKLNEIAGKAGMETGACSNLIASLISLGLVKKETPVHDGSTRKTIYRLEDPMFRFWYRFVLPNLSRISMGLGEDAYTKDVKPFLAHFMGPVFEMMSMQYLWQLARQGQSPFAFKEMGRWWGGNQKEKRQEEIDLLATDGDEALFGECKWSINPVDTAVLDSLMEKSRLFEFRTCHYWLFSKSGYTKRCMEAANKLERVKLVSFNDMN